MGCRLAGPEADCWIAVSWGYHGSVRLRFYIDPVTGGPHIHDHDVDETEVEEVLASPDEDRSGSEGSRIAIGTTGAGRVLRVVSSPYPEPDSAFVITAHERRSRRRTRRR